MSNEFEMIIIGVGSVFIIYCVTVGSAFIVSKINEVKESSVVTKNKILLSMLNTGEKVIEVVTKGVVCKLEQTEAKDIRKQIKAGIADKESLKALAQKAYEEIYTSVSPDVLKELATAVTDVEGCIKNEIERQVALLKRDK
ncbi:MAG: hypothetical protein ACRCW1_06195 [Anaerotignaceae bacterium]